MVIYVPGTEETDLKKVIMSLQQVAAAVTNVTKINVGGTDLVPSVANVVSIGGGASSSLLAVGQDVNHHVEVFWSYDVNPASASAFIATFGYLNNLDISANVLSLQGNSGLPTTIGGTLTVAGNLSLHLAASVTPANNGDVVFQATSNTSFTIKYKGSDGVVRSGSVTLA